MLREFGLIAFTILAQMSVGAFIVMGIFHFYVTKKAGIEEADRMGDRSVVVIIIVLGLGLLASLLHLGSPLKAPTAVTNFATSWLSREVLSGVVFVVLGGLYAILQWFKVGPLGLRNIVGWLAGIVGLVLVFCMSNVYMLPTQPAWNTIATPIFFYTTTFLLGSLAMGAAYVTNYAYVQKKNPGCADMQCELMRTALRWIAIVSVVLLGVVFVVTPAYLLSLATGSPQAIESAKLIAGPLGVAFMFRMILATLGAGVFGFFLYQNAQVAGKEKALGNIAWAAFILVLVAEVLGRYVFYASQVGITL